MICNSMDAGVLEFLTTSTPFVAIAVMALLVAVNPCPLATVISSLLYLTSSPTLHQRGWWLTALYALGRALLYFFLGVLSVLLLRVSIQTLHIQEQILYGLEHFLGPLIIILGILLWIFGCQRHKGHHHESVTTVTDDAGQPSTKSGVGGWRALWLGFTTALFFCPTVGLIYFGMLIPMTAQAELGIGFLYLLLFALLTSSIAYPIYGIIRMGISRLERFAGSMQRWRKRLNMIISILFILMGLAITLSHLLYAHGELGGNP